MAKLRIIAGITDLKSVALNGELVTIGRAPDNTLPIPHKSISNYHATLHSNGGSYIITDLTSTNGVVINGERKTSATLSDGDRVHLGDIELRFELEPALCPVAQTPSPSESKASTDIIQLPQIVETKRPSPAPKLTPQPSASPLIPLGQPRRVAAEEPVLKLKKSQTGKSLRSIRNLSYMLSLVVGALMFFLGYPLELNTMKFIGLVLGFGGLLCWLLDPFSQGKRKAKMPRSARADADVEPAPMSTLR